MSSATLAFLRGHLALWAAFAALAWSAPAVAQQKPDDKIATDDAAARAEKAAERAEKAAERLEKATRELEAARAALEKEREAKKEHAEEERKVEIGGYLKPGFGFRFRPQALPKDKYEYGFFGDATLEVTAKPFKMWEANVAVDFSTEALRAVTDVAIFDLQGDGSIDGVQFSTDAVPGAVLQEATVSFIPHETVTMALGVTRIPFTLAQQAGNSELMFATRAEPNEVFLSGSDFGFTVTGNFWKGRFVPAVGVFNGDSLGLSIAETEARGVVISARVDGNPLGGFDDGEGDYARGKFRIGFGAGAMVRPATLYDKTTGAEPHSVIDARFSGSLRVSVRGFYFVAEYFRRQQKDDFSSRPEAADGAYGQVGYFFRAGESFGLEPIARLGFVARDRTFETRLTGYVDGGINLLPVATAPQPDDVKVQLSYKGERRFTEREEAHGVLASVQLKF
jgi:hypothetical protein